MAHRRSYPWPLLLLLLAPLGARAAVTQSSRFDLKRPEIVAFVNDVVARDSLSRRKVLRLLAKAEPQPKILEIMTRPAEKVTPWWEYRARFLTEERIAEGARFYQD
ncbi:MAG TPA: lytic murein transglycosylase, partial [Steroidobacteraceae bacterium]|nr:lytic murein transglycosylase [Steroidobacteraceae bacterium]